MSRNIKEHKINIEKVNVMYYIVLLNNSIN